MEYYHHDFLQNIDDIEKVIEQIGENRESVKDLVIDPLVGTELTSEHCKRLANALLLNTHLSLIDIAGHHLGDNNVKLLLHSLRSSAPSLSHLDLSFNSLSHSFLPELSLLLRLIAHHHTGKGKGGEYTLTLILDDNKLGDKGAKELGKAVKRGHVTDLRLRSNLLSSEGALFLFRAASSPLSRLRSLLLNGNSFSSPTPQHPSTLKLISRHLSLSSSLKHLDLGNCSLSDSDLLSLFSYPNSSLSYVGLEANRLTEKSTETICKMIKSKYGKPVKQWNLQRNNRLLYVNVDQEGLLRPTDHLLVWDPWIIPNSHFFTHLIQTLSENPHVIFVDIGDKLNILESELITRFEAQLSANKIAYQEAKRNVIEKRSGVKKYVIAGVVAGVVIGSLAYYYFTKERDEHTAPTKSIFQLLNSTV